tara:strand:+ start:150 stop:323 length:174 start_codon:yes stop_codon:yes gene_type:complete
MLKLSFQVLEEVLVMMVCPVEVHDVVPLQLVLVVMAVLTQVIVIQVLQAVQDFMEIQ